jgi:hypothetical protein
MVGDVPDRTTHELDQLPEESRLRSVTAAPADIAGRQALRVELTDTVTFNGKPGVDYVDMPTFVIIPATFTDGTIEVDILSRLNGKGPADARAFAGIAYRIAEGGDRFEAVYLRPLNGLKTNPPSPRDQRAILCKQTAAKQCPHLLACHRVAGGQTVDPAQAGTDPHPGRLTPFGVIRRQPGVTFLGRVQGCDLAGQVVIT